MYTALSKDIDEHFLEEEIYQLIAGWPGAIYQTSMRLSFCPSSRDYQNSHLMGGFEEIIS